MGRCGRAALLAALVASLWVRADHGFYIPGVAPTEFGEGDPVEVRSIKLTSVKTQIPYEYYSVPFCVPAEGITHYSENLGEVLRGDRITNTAFMVFMRRHVACAAVCGSNEKPTSLTAEQTANLRRMIMEEYHVHLLVDNLPCATRVPVPHKDRLLYDNGYRLGYVSADGQVHVNNHVTLVLHYHEHAPGQYRVVLFEVEPRSIDYKQLQWADGACTEPAGKVAPMVLQANSESQVVWTYSVRWEESPVKWASRWDTYLAMRDAHIHWFSIVNSIIVVFCLSGFVAVIMVRTVRRDIAAYNRDELEMEDAMEETGWKLVHGDVFRPPPYQKLLTSVVGTGIQLALMVAVTVTFAMLGMLSPASRGSLMTAALFLYCFMGLIAGYYAGRLYKALRGTQWKRAAFQTGFLFPATILGAGLVLNFFLMGKHSSGAVPFGTMVALVAMWFGIDLPLVFMGFYFGFRKQAYQHPVRTNQIPRQVPEQPWYLKLLPCMAMAGVLPFGAMFIELFFIFSALWENQFYYLFGFLFLVVIILGISTAEISIVVTYFQLCAENHHWWWRSWIIGGSSAIYGWFLEFVSVSSRKVKQNHAEIRSVRLRCLFLLHKVKIIHAQLDIVGFTPRLLFFAYSALMSFGFFMVTACIGFYSTYWFICKIYGAVKID